MTRVPCAGRFLRRTLLGAAAATSLSACGLLRQSADGREAPADHAEWPSPSGRYRAGLSRVQGSSSASVIITAASGERVYTATRGLSLRMSLTVRWLPDDVLRVESSDIGTWTVAQVKGVLTETWFGPSATPS